MANVQIVPVFMPTKNVIAQTLELRVPLYSPGCERKMKKALSHIRGLYSVEADLASQKVTVVGIVNSEEVLAAVRAKRRNSSFWNSVPAPQPVLSSPSNSNPTKQEKSVAKPNPPAPKPVNKQQPPTSNQSSNPKSPSPKQNPKANNAPSASKPPPKPKQPKNYSNNNGKAKKNTVNNDQSKESNKA